MRIVRLIAMALLIALVAPAPGSAATPPYSNADYWAFADSVMRTLDAWWDGRVYVLGTGPSTRVNSALLLTHAIAAKTGHEGPTRQDARAGALVDRLTNAPAWLGARGSGRLTTCWSRDVHRVKRQHASLEPKVAEALAWAWRARAELGLSAAAVARIERRVTACARSPAWRRVRVANQINWNAELYASAAVVSGRSGLLRHRYRSQLGAFAADPANWGRGMQFHYQPQRPSAAGINLDTPEYASLVADALGHYDEALRRGMRPLPASSMRRLRDWVTRLLAGSWTHAGYLNWDTGKGRRRWHSAQYWAFAQEGLLAIATSPRFWGRRTAIESRWTVTCAGGCRRRVLAYFPTWGAGAAIHAVRRDGTRVPLTPGGPHVALADVAVLELGSGYRVVPLGAPRAATLTAIAVARQPTNPHPGPSLQVELARRGGFHRRTLAVRIEPAP